MEDSLEAVGCFLNQLTRDGRRMTEEDTKKMKTLLEKIPGRLVNYTLSNQLLEHAKKTGSEKAAVYRRILYQHMTVARFELFREVLLWLRQSEEKWTEEIGPSLFHTRRSCNDTMAYLLQHDCLSKPNLEREEQRARRHYRVGGHLDYELVRKFNDVLAELTQKTGRKRDEKMTVKSGGDQLTVKEYSDKETARISESVSQALKVWEEEQFTAVQEESQAKIEAYTLIRREDGSGCVDVERRETAVWHQSTILSRKNFFEEKFVKKYGK